MLIDSVLFSKSIPSGNKKELLEKLKELSNKYFKFSAATIQSYDSADREINKELFYTIEMLDEAISKGLKVKFFYNEYGADKKLRHRLNEAGDAREYIINPYIMAANSGKYYLICNYDKFDDIAHYRIDRISNIQILDTPRKPRNRVKGLVSFGGVLGVLLVGVVEKLGGHPPGADLSHRNFLRLKLEGEGIAVMLNKGLC